MRAVPSGQGRLRRRCALSFAHPGQLAPPLDLLTIERFLRCGAPPQALSRALPRREGEQVLHTGSARVPVVQFGDDLPDLGPVADF